MEVGYRHPHNPVRQVRNLEPGWTIRDHRGDVHVVTDAAGEDTRTACDLKTGSLSTIHVSEYVTVVRGRFTIDGCVTEMDGELAGYG